jgi:uncharacterized protein YqhQ
VAVFLFILAPLWITTWLKDYFTAIHNWVVFNVVDGLIRVVFFLAYILLISRMKDNRRVFQYHGAEHKVIHAYESCGRPDAEYAKGFSTLHPRCGTGFLLLVMILSVFLFAIIGKPSVPWLVLSRLIGIPLIIGIAYEIGIKWAGRSDGVFARAIMWPGLQLQRLTTREPSDGQLEVAAAALEEVMAMDEAERVAQQEALVPA